MRTTLLTSICLLIAVAAGGQGMSPKRLEMLKLWRIIDELEIEEQQAAELFPYWSKSQRDKRGLGDQRREATRSLHDLLEAGAGDAELEKQIEAIREIEERAHLLDKRFRDGLRKYLDVRQQAQLMVFEERFRGDLRDMVRGFRRMHRDGTGRGARAGDGLGDPFSE